LKKQIGNLLLVEASPNSAHVTQRRWRAAKRLFRVEERRGGRFLPSNFKKIRAKAHISDGLVTIWKNARRIWPSMYASESKQA